MSKKDRVYGCIFCYVGSFNREDYAKDCSSNLWALEALPIEDEYPQMTRNLFSLSLPRYAIPGLYKEQVIHFGGTFKDIEEDWDIWLDKLKSFLWILKWNEAHVHVEFEYPPTQHSDTKFSYTWKYSDQEDPDNWEFSGGPTEFGLQLARVRECIQKTSELLESEPNNPKLLETLIYALSRDRQYIKAYEMYERLKKLDTERAEKITADVLFSWSERYLGLEIHAS